MTTLMTLTDFEQIGLHSNVCLADGHAYQDLHPVFAPIIQSLPDIWYRAASQSIPEAEQCFNHHFSALIQAPILHDFKNFRICPTASNSIDLVGAVLKNLQYNTALIEPTFDNLALLLKRRGVDLTSVHERALFEAVEQNEIDEKLFSKKIDALFLVNPNNPTGLTFSENSFKNLVNFCKKKSITLVIDNCFRVYRRTKFCDYSILIESGVSFIAFEDTGKVWPTQDMKASLVYFSDDLATIFKELYNEIYLCVSSFTLGVLSSFFEKTAKVGLNTTIWDIVDSRRALLRQALKGSMFAINQESLNSSMPVEWLEYLGKDKIDLVLCQELKHLELAVLPGRQFYWDSSDDKQNQKNIRISLMKREAIFNAGISIFSQYIQNMKSTYNDLFSAANPEQKIIIA